jgi:hypothetical protein
VLELAVFDPSEGHFIHPDGQFVRLSGPICNLDAEPGMPPSKSIFLDFDMYGEMPQDGSVLIAVQWRYYPDFCEATSTNEWSPPTGSQPWFYTGANPDCDVYRFPATLNDLVPSTAQMVIPMIYMIADCDIIARPAETNFTRSSIISRQRVEGSAHRTSPRERDAVQDVGSFHVLSICALGPANIVFNKSFAVYPRYRLIRRFTDRRGPLAATTQLLLEAKLWWRRGDLLQSDKSSGVDTAYKIWRDRVADGLAIDRPYKPEFTFGTMDSIQIGSIPMKTRLHSRFSEKDDDFLGEIKASDMIPDDVLLPGTRIEYFLTSNYMKSPNDLYSTRTPRGNLFEFEILPGVRTAYVPTAGLG